jgi:hypothetical protein
MRYHLIAGGVVAAVVIVLVAVVMLVGSGQSSLAEAAGRLEGQSARMALTMGLTFDGQQAAMKGTSIQNANGTQIRIEAETTYDGETGPLKQTILVVGEQMWMTSEGFEEIMPEGKKWVRFKDATIGGETMSLTEFADFLTSAQDIEDRGEVEIGGRKTTHFQGAVSVRELANKTGGETAKRLKAALQGSDALVPVEAWVGEDGRIARMAMTVEDPKEAMSITYDVLEYGVPVDVQPPPASETISEAEFDRLPAAG